jgi:hypothetical protein
MKVRTIQKRMRHAVKLAKSVGYDPYNSAAAFGKAFKMVGGR